MKNQIKSLLAAKSQALIKILGSWNLLLPSPVTHSAKRTPGLILVPVVAKEIGVKQLKPYK